MAQRSAVSVEKLHQPGIFFSLFTNYFATDGNSETHACCEE
jgi:hypothetical protein